MKIKKVIPNLINGVSQQPATLRLPTQSAEEINTYNSVVDGSMKRPPIETIAQISTEDINNAFIYFIKRDLKERYILVIANQQIKIYDITGVERTVNISTNAEKYLVSTNPLNYFTATTIADYTFILNKERYVRIKNKYDEGSLIPIYEKRQVLTFRPVPRNFMMQYERTGDDYSAGAYTGIRISSIYKINIAGHIISLMPSRKIRYGSEDNMSAGRDCYINVDPYEEPSLNEFKELIIKYIEETLGLKCEKGQNDIHIITDTELAITDISEYWECYNHYRYISGMFKTYWRDDYWNVSGRYQVITKAEFGDVLIGYETEDGDIIPPESIYKNEAIVFVKIGNYSCNYVVFIDDVKYAEYKTSDTDKNTIATDFIAGELFNILNADVTLKDKFELYLKGSVIKIVAKEDDADFKITTQDSMSDQALSAIKGSTQDLSDLPKVCFEGFTVQINPSNIDEAAYYVQYKEGATGGYWEEDKKRGLNTQLVSETMPHRLISHADGSFTFESVPWAERLVGDTDSSPEPSFVNNSLNAILFYQNRLVLLSDENIILSSDGDYYNVYPTTVRTILDSDPIDLSATTDVVAILKQGCLFNEQLLLFADTIQFTLNYEGILSLNTVSLNTTTRFNALLKAQPVGSGNYVFFPFKRGLYSGLFEYYVDTDIKLNDAIDITNHVPNYIKGEIEALSCNSTHNTVAALTNGELDTIYVYSFYSQNKEKLQSAWCKWKTDGNVLALDDYDSGFFIVTKRDTGGLFLEKIDLSLTKEPIAKGWRTDILLDRRQWSDIGAIIPDYLQGNNWRAVSRAGEVFEESNKDKLINIDGTLKEAVYVGYPYLMTYQFSRFNLNSSTTNIGNLTDKLKIQSFYLSYKDSNNFTVTVELDNRPPTSKSVSDSILGASSNVLGEKQLITGTLKILVNSDAASCTITINSDSFLPCNFQSASWSGITRPTAKII